MSRAARGPALLGALAAAIGLLACGQDRVASSEVGNPPAKGIITGALIEDSDSPAAGARVRLYPAGHDPVRDSADTSLARYLDTADTEGVFTFPGLEPGLYNVVAIHPATGHMALLRDVRAPEEGSVTAPGGVLHPPGAVTLTVPDPPSHGEAYVYIEGTGIYARVPGGGGSPAVRLEGVPAGAVPAIRFRPAPGDSAPVLFEGITVGPGDTVAASLLPGWAYSRRLFLNTGTTGVDVAEDAAHFPVLVRLGQGGAPFDFRLAAGDGRDLRFVDRKGGRLDHEIETWDSAGGRAAVWVSPGILEGGDSTQFLRLFWGNPVAGSATTRAFPEALGHVGVWHLQSLSGGRMPDGSSAGNEVIADSVTASLVRPSLIGRGIHLDGKGRYLMTSKAVPNPHAFSLSLWFRTTTDSGGKLIGFGVLQGIADSSRDRHVWMDDSGRVHFGVFLIQGAGPHKQAVLSAPGRWNDGQWHQVGASLGPAGMVLYLDGRKVAEDTATRSAQDYAGGHGYWRMGFDFPFYDWPHPPSARFFRGDLDEVQVSHKAFDAAWFRLLYETQKDGARLVRFE